MTIIEAKGYSPSDGDAILPAARSYFLPAEARVLITLRSPLNRSEAVNKSTIEGSQHTLTGH